MRESPSRPARAIRVMRRGESTSGSAARLNAPSAPKDVSSTASANTLVEEGAHMETHIPNRISTACEALNFLSSYGRICEAHDVKKPEMGGLAAVCDLVRGHLEVVEPTVENIAIRSKEKAEV